VAGVSAQSRAKNGFAATLKRGHWEKTLPRAGKQEVKKMLNKLLIAGIAGAAFVAIGASTANAQNNANCAIGINTVALSRLASCRIYFVPDLERQDSSATSTFTTTFRIRVSQWSFGATPVTSSMFVLLSDSGAQGQTFDYSYTIEIDNTDPMGPENEFKSVALTLVLGQHAAECRRDENVSAVR
jgi:hypothetical protein